MNKKYELYCATGCVVVGNVGKGFFKINPNHFIELVKDWRHAFRGKWHSDISIHTLSWDKEIWIE